MPFPFPAHGVQARRALIPPWKDPGADVGACFDIGLGRTLSSALLTNWTDQAHGYSATPPAGKEPTYGAAAITDELGLTYPGAVLSGGQGLVISDAGFKTWVSAKQSMHVIAAGVSNTPAGLQVLVELGITWFNAVGQFGIFINDTNSFSIEAGVRGAGAGLGIWRGDAGTFPWADPGVVHFALGGATVGSTAHELDGVEMLGGAIGGGNAYAAGNFASANAYVGFRGDNSNFGYFTLSSLTFLGPTSTVAAIRNAHLWAGAKVGAVQG